MSKPPNPRDDKFFEAIRASELGEQIARQIDEQRLAARKAVADELAALHKGAEREHPKLACAQEKALSEYRELEKKLQAARQKLAQANGAKLSASAIYTARRDELERALVDGASPLIGEFVEWCEDERARSRKMLRTSYSRRKHPVTGVVTDHCLSNAESVNARSAALLAAIEAARDMRLLADQSRVPEMLKRLKAELPEVKEI